MDGEPEILREGPGTRIGPYQLLQQIGEGGFGAVFLAEQEKPVARRVALKILKLGMDTRQVVARFEQERQALALMDHPNIARVIDAGATETGRPYFVMDLVRGEPIAEYCDKNHLSIDERLELFAQVCNAVQHAHTKGIIHRDLKPSNLLVATQDGHPLVKVIDFGIAKATSAKLTDKTLFTEQQQIIGTVQYMSPEQAEGSLDIDTRTDVYALGVVLYELLTGSTPFDAKTLREAFYSEVQRMIREVEPPKPSTRLHQSADTLATIAARRRVEPKRLGAIVRGELDWIVMKALEKDRARRYGSASEFSADIGNYLGGAAVVAAPPSAAYRFKKFVRRHRVTVTAVGAVAAALLAGVITFAWQASVIRVQRDRAVAAEGESDKRANELRQVSEFQGRMLAQIDPTAAGRSLTADVQSKFTAALVQAGVPETERSAQTTSFAGQWSRVNATDTARNLIDRTILSPAVSAIDKQFADQPKVDAQLREVLAQRYKDLGLYEAALPLQERALAIRRRVLGLEDPETLASINNLGDLLRAQGKLDEAEPVCREALERSRRVLGDDHPLTLLSMGNLGFLLRLRGKLDEAEPFCRESLEKQRRVLGEEDRNTLSSIDGLGQLVQAQGKFDEADACFREALAKSRRVLGEEDRQTLITLSNLSNLLMVRGKLSEAEPYIRECVEKFGRVQGEDHPDEIAAINNLGYVLWNLGKQAEAEKYYRDALEKYRRVLGDEHPDTLTAINNLGILLQDEGKLGEAEQYLREVMEKRRRLLGEEHADTLGSIGNVGRLLLAAGKLTEAEPFLREALEKKRRVRGEDNPDTVVSMNTLGTLLQAQGKLDEAEPYFVDALEKCRRVLGEEHPNTLISVVSLGRLWVAQKKYAEAIALLAPAEPAVRKTFTGANVKRFQTLLVNLGRARTATGAFAAAEANLLETGATTREATQAIVDLYTAWNTAEPNQGHDAKVAEWTAKLEGN